MFFISILLHYRRQRYGAREPHDFLIPGLSARIFFPMPVPVKSSWHAGGHVGVRSRRRPGDGEPFQVFFFIVLPIMAGGARGGAIQLSQSASPLMHMDRGGI